MAQLSARERRLIAVLLLVAAVAVAWVAVVAPIIDGFAARAAEHERLRAVFAANGRLVANIPRLRRLAEAQRAQTGSFQIVAGDAVAAQEILKERLSSAVERAGGTTTATEDVEGDAGWVQAWVQARATQAQMIRVLADLQNSTPYLVVTSVAVSADRAGQSDGSASSDGTLDIRIEVAARHAAS
ncbi:MAG: type II secretion system protein GspM [Sphingomonas sp.]